MDISATNGMVAQRWREWNTGMSINASTPRVGKGMRLQMTAWLVGTSISERMEERPSDGGTDEHVADLHSYSKMLEYGEGGGVSPGSSNDSLNSKWRNRKKKNRALDAVGMESSGLPRNEHCTFSVTDLPSADILESESSHTGPWQRCDEPGGWTMALSVENDFLTAMII